MVKFEGDSILPISFKMDDDDAPQIYLNPIIEKIALKYNITILQTLKVIQDGYNYYRDEGFEWAYGYDEWKEDVYKTFGFGIMPMGGGRVSDSIFERIVNVISSHGIKTPLNSAFENSGYGEKYTLKHYSRFVGTIFAEYNFIQLYLGGWEFSPGIFTYKVKKSKAGHFLNWVDNPFGS